MSTDSVLKSEFVHIFRNLFVVYNFHVVNDVWGIVDTSNKDISDMLDVSLEKKGFFSGVDESILRGGEWGRSVVREELKGICGRWRCLVSSVEAKRPVQLSG